MNRVGLLTETSFNGKRCARAATSKKRRRRSRKAERGNQNRGIVVFRSSQLRERTPSKVREAPLASII